MNCAPCLSASCARTSSFWIMDSLSPVQLAWTSAPRTIRDIGSPLEREGWVRGERVHRALARRPRVATRLTGTRPGRHRARCRRCACWRAMGELDVPATLPPPPDAVVPAPVAVRRGRVARSAGWFALAGFGAIFGLVKARRTDAIDLAVTLKLQRRREPVLQPVMRAVSWPGFPPQSHVIPA